jgi:hypothetical protein
MIDLMNFLLTFLIDMMNLLLVCLIYLMNFVLMCLNQGVNLMLKLMLKSVFNVLEMRGFFKEVVGSLIHVLLSLVLNSLNTLVFVKWFGFG